jgi:hypothetical protein
MIFCYLNSFVPFAVQIFIYRDWRHLGGETRLPQLQLQLLDKDAENIVVFIPQEKSLHRCCPSCKKGILITLFTFDCRGPPKDYKKIAKRKVLKYSNL